MGVVGSGLKRFAYDSIGEDKKARKPPPTRASVPPELSLTELDNVAVPVSYFVSGLCPALLANPLNIYMIENIDATAAQQNTVLVLMSIPWCFKIFFGLLSDAVPLGGQKRKPYMLLGYAIHLLSIAALSSVARPSITQLATGLSLSMLGLVWADVMADAFVVQKSRLEPAASRGHFQAACYLSRYWGSLVGSVLGALLYNQRGWHLEFSSIVWLLFAVPLALLAPLMPFLLDERPVAVGPDGQLSGKGYERVGVRAQLAMVWDVVQNRAVWQPVMFIYLYNSLQWSNAGYGSFQRLGLGFQAWQMGSLLVAGNLVTLGGMEFFRRRMRGRWSLHKIYLWSTLLQTAFVILQIMLVFGVNRRLGISDFAFSIFDNVATQGFGAVMLLPVCMLCASLCPEGSECVVYAILTSFTNVGSMVGGSFSNVISHVWDVSNAAMKAHQWDGLWKLTLLSQAASLLPLLFLYRMLPSPARQRELVERPQRSAFAGKCFLAVLGLSTVWSLMEGLVELMAGSGMASHSTSHRAARLAHGMGAAAPKHANFGGGLHHATNSSSSRL
jgi:hypothetical protein